MRGSGPVEIRRGSAPSAAIVLTGSGNVEHGCVVGRLNAVLRGSGSIEVARALGPVTSQRAGSGSIRVGGAELAVRERRSREDRGR